MTASVPQIFEQMPARYVPGKIAGGQTYYFSIGDHKYTVRLTRETCIVEDGKTVERADCVLKTTPELFTRMVIEGKLPGALDIARGKVKTNDPIALKRMRDYFDFSGIV